MASKPNNLPTQIGVPPGAPFSFQGVAAYLTHLMSALNGWVGQAATAINYLLSLVGTNTLAADTDVSISSPTAGQVLTYNGVTWFNADPSGGDGTVTSVDASGGSTGLTFTGGPIKSAGILVLSGTLVPQAGGTGQTTYSNGDLLIGNSGTLSRAQLTAGANITITPGPGSITIASAGGGGGGTVTSVGLSMPGEFAVSGSPIVSSGTLGVTWASESANTVLAGPTSGAAATPSFRALVAADIPPISLTSGVTGVLPIANGGTGQSVQNSAAAASFGNTTAISSTAAFLMAGIGGSMTPATTGRMLIIFTGSGKMSVAGDRGFVQMRYGTGAAPVNGAASTGTSAGPTHTFVTASAAEQMSLTFGWVVTGLTPGTTYWLDMAIETPDGGSCTFTTPSFTTVEI